MLVANKLDLVHKREDLFPGCNPCRNTIRSLSLCRCRRKEADTRRLLEIVRPYLPQQGWWYDADALTDRTDRFLASEIIREKLFRLTGDELPYTSTVVIDAYAEEASSQQAQGDGAGAYRGHHHRGA